MTKSEGAKLVERYVSLDPFLPPSEIVKRIKAEHGLDVIPQTASSVRHRYITSLGPTRKVSIPGYNRKLLVPANARQNKDGTGKEPNPIMEAVDLMATTNPPRPAAVTVTALKQLADAVKAVGGKQTAIEIITLLNI